MVACFERVIRFITDSAYIMMAISGKGFCASAAEAFYLMLRQTSQQFVTYSTLFLFKWFGKLLISLLSMFIGLFLIINIESIWNKIYSPLFPVIAFFVVSYPIASTFMEFFAMSAKTLLMCYCIQMDLVVNRATCPPALRNFFEDYVQDSQYFGDS
jgi:choline transporter-like protein 2/4/5